MRVLICGDRLWEDETLIATVLEQLAPAGTVVIEGGARGADRMAAKSAVALGLDHLEFPARWTQYGTAAGPIRNRQMLAEGQPTEVWAFHDHIELSRGTANMIRQALKAGVPVRLFTHAQPRGKEVTELEAD